MYLSFDSHFKFRFYGSWPYFTMNKKKAGHIKASCIVHLTERKVQGVPHLLMNY